MNLSCRTGRRPLSDSLAVRIPLPGTAVRAGRGWKAEVGGGLGACSAAPLPLTNVSFSHQAPWVGHSQH